MAALRELNASLHGRTAKLRNPFDEVSLAWYAWIVARLGGWSGYTSRGYKPPGPKTMHRGMIIVEQILTGWRLAIRFRRCVTPVGARRGAGPYVRCKATSDRVGAQQRTLPHEGSSPKRAWTHSGAH